MTKTKRYALNDLQQSVIDALDDAESTLQAPFPTATASLLEILQQVPGHDDLTMETLKPCLATLKRRGLIDHPVGDKRGREVYVTDEGRTYADGAAPDEADERPTGPLLCASCNAPESEPHREGCEYLPKPDPEPAAEPQASPDPVTHIDPETRRVILPDTADEEGDDEPFTVEPPCSGCEAQVGEHHDPECPAVDAFTAGRIPSVVDERPEEAEPGEDLGGMECPAGAEKLDEGSAPDRVERPDNANLVRLGDRLNLLLAQNSAADSHDPVLQSELVEVLEGLAAHSRRAAEQPTTGDDQRHELNRLAEDCYSLANRVARSLIAPGLCPAAYA